MSCSPPSSTRSAREVVAELGFSALKFDLDVPTPYMQDTASGTLSRAEVGAMVELRDEAENGRISIRQKAVTLTSKSSPRTPTPTTRGCWMCSMPIEVTKPGLATTVQDRRRESYYHVGAPPSGALDQFSLVAANLLVGNPAEAAAPECAYMGPELHCTESTVVAATGAEVELRLNGDAQPGWTSIAVSPGDVLTFGHIKRGARMYLAVAGGIDIPEVLGSRATYVLGGLGGLEGRVLQPGDELAIGSAADGAVGRSVPQDLRPDLPTELEIRVVMGLYDHLLTDGGRETFLATSWTLTPVADRVGFRYKGAELDMVQREQPFGAGSDPSNIVDAPYPIGSIQVPGGVEPIVLHRDAVSGDGYAMMATVIRRQSSARTWTPSRSPRPARRPASLPVDLEAALTARRERADRVSRLQSVLD